MIQLGDHNASFLSIEWSQSTSWGPILLVLHAYIYYTYYFYNIYIHFSVYIRSIIMYKHIYIYSYIHIFIYTHNIHISSETPDAHHPRGLLMAFVPSQAIQYFWKLLDIHHTGCRRLRGL